MCKLDYICYYILAMFPPNLRGYIVKAPTEAYVEDLIFSKVNKITDVDLKKDFYTLGKY